MSLRVGRGLKNTKMLKHFELTIEDASFSYHRQEEQIAEEALDGLYVIRTSVPQETLSTGETVSAYKGLSQVERDSTCPERVPHQG